MVSPALIPAGGKLGATSIIADRAPGSSILRQTLTDAGIPTETLFNLAAQQTVKDELSANTQRGFDDGAFGRPSFVFQGELFFGKDKLDDVEAWLASRSS